MADKDYKVAFAKNSPSSVIGVYNKATGASGSGNITLKVKGIKKKINVDNMKIQAENDEFILLTCSVIDNFPADKMAKVQQAMTSLKDSDKGKAVLKSAHVTNLHAAKDADFAMLQEITKYAIADG